MEVTDIALFVGSVAILSTILRWVIPDGSGALRKKFVKLGNLKVRTLQEIVSAAGKYSMMESYPSGKSYTWSQPKYSIKLGLMQIIFVQVC